MMYLPPEAKGRYLRAAEQSRCNRLEIVQALSQGKVERRDLFKWGLFTVTGGLLLKHGLHPFVGSAP